MKNQDISVSDFDGQHEAQKRKWPYNGESNGNSYAIYTNDKGVNAKKPMTTYDYDNFQPNHQYIISNASNGHEPSQNALSTNDGGDDDGSLMNCAQPATTQMMLNTMEISENIEYVNILYEDELLTSIQAPVATETNYINFEPNWSNADILDLDQRHFYYETSNNSTHTSIDLNHLNGHMSSQSNEHNTSASSSTSSSTSSIHIQHQQQITDNNTQANHLQMSEQISNNHIHNITEYEIVQNVYPEPDGGQEQSTSNLRM